MDLTLTPEQEMVRKTAREFADREIAPFARDWDRAEQMDRAIVGKLAELGFLGAPIPEEYGGGGLDNVSYCLIVEEVGRADSSVRGVISVNSVSSDFGSKLKSATAASVGRSAPPRSGWIERSGSSYSTSIASSNFCAT